MRFATQIANMVFIEQPSGGTITSLLPVCPCDALPLFTISTSYYILPRHCRLTGWMCIVGYSYSDTKDDYRTNDQQAAADNYQILQKFLERFPEYSQNPLYSSAESYGGHFMPELARQVVTENANLSTLLCFTPTGATS
jgi:hypothetical protein